MRILARLARVAERACQGTGISLPQYRLLLCLSERPQRASALATRLGVSRPTLTSLVDGLERNGLLRRQPVATDRRGILLEPTPAGRAALDRADHALQARILQLIDHGTIDCETARHAGRLVDALEAALDREGAPLTVVAG